MGVHRRYGHDLALWLCDEPSAAFTDAYRLLRGALVGAGYSWTDRGHGHSHLVACWWDMGVTVDADALQAEVDRVVAEAAAARAERARIEAERLAAEVAEVAPEAAPIRERLRVLLWERRWALGRDAINALALVGREGWTRRCLSAATGCIENAEANVRRAAERLGRPAPAVWHAKAADPAIRAAALEACRVLSALDADWAAVRNGAGWSQATCWTGHTLSERESLDQGEAAHALALLHGHRRQVPDDLAMALFGETYGRKRRPSAEDAPRWLSDFQDGALQSPHRRPATGPPHPNGDPLMSFIARLISSIMRAIFGVLTLPLRLLGWEPKPTAAAVAEAAVEAVRADPVYVPPAPAPREPTPMADLLLQHARKRLFTHERHDVIPLPLPLEAWIEQLDAMALANVISCPARDLQRHINAGLGGSTALGPFRLPAVVPGAVPMPTKSGATGGTGGPARAQPVDLSAALEELGLIFEGPAPRLRPRPR